MKNPSKIPLLRRVLPLLLLLMAILCAQAQSNRYGKDRALLFAVNNYEQMVDLKNPIQNARDIGEELEQRYGFTVEVVSNPTYDKIEEIILEYYEAYSSNKFKSDGQLFIFFSGHGMTEGTNGYFMPADADPDRPYKTGIEYDFWRSKISEINCKHILVAIDACHSITFDPQWESRSDRSFSRPGTLEQEKVLMNHDQYRARLFITSDAQGDKTPDRSTFANKILEGLRIHKYTREYMMAIELYANYLTKASPRPGAGDFENHQPGSSFLFFPKQDLVNLNENYGARQRDINVYKAIKANGTIAACQQYLKDYPNGEFRNEVDQILNALIEKQDWEYAQLKNTVKAYQAYMYKYPYSPHYGTAQQKVATLQNKGTPSKTTPPKSNSSKQPGESRKKVIEVSGVITNKDGEPVVDAYVLISGTSISTVSNINGVYSLEIDDIDYDYELVVSLPGYTTQRINIGDRRIVDVVLKDAFTRVSEIRGKITDESGESIIRANILIIGTSRGTITDFDGGFSLQIKEGDNRIVVSRRGFKAKEVNIGYEERVNVSLEKKGFKKILGL
jgi:hypothetical protein